MIGLYILPGLEAVNSCTYCSEFTALSIWAPLLSSSQFTLWLLDKWGPCLQCWPLLLPCHPCCCCDWWLIQMYCQVNWSELNVRGDLQQHCDASLTRPFYRTNPTLKQCHVSPATLVSGSCVLHINVMCTCHQRAPLCFILAALKGDISDQNTVLRRSFSLTGHKYSQCQIAFLTFTAIRADFIP